MSGTESDVEEDLNGCCRQNQTRLETAEKTKRTPNEAEQEKQAEHNKRKKNNGEQLV